MAVAAMRARDVVVDLERFTDAHRHRFLPYIQMRKSRHQRARIEFIHLLLELADAHHFAVHADPLLRRYARFGFGLSGSYCHFPTPDIRASTSNITAKSCFAQPIPRAAVRNSLAAAVVGNGTSR